MTKVRPTKDHPLYWDWQFGLLYLWLFSKSDDDALDRARAILEPLPYERVGEIVVCCRETDAKFLQKEEEAQKLGLALLLGSCATGTDEGDFETEESP